MQSPIDHGVVLVTGASSGIGRELALLVAPRAKAVVLVARREDRLSELKTALLRVRAGLDVHVFACDVTDRAAVDAMLADAEAKTGGIDVLVNNAGLGDLGVFERTSWEKVKSLIEVNVTSLVYLTHKLVAKMVARGKGGVLNVSSGFGVTFGPGMAVYIGAKHFVTGFTEGLRLDLAGTGVVVTQICPGPVATEFEQHIGNFTGLHATAIEISANACARAAIRAFDRRRALVVPGFWSKILIFMGVWSPRWLLRLVYRPIARALRKRQLESERAAP